MWLAKKLVYGIITKSCICIANYNCLYKYSIGRSLGDLMNQGSQQCEIFEINTDHMSLSYISLNQNDLDKLDGLESFRLTSRFSEKDFFLYVDLFWFSLRNIRTFGNIERHVLQDDICMHVLLLKHIISVLP